MAKSSYSKKDVTKIENVQERLKALEAAKLQIEKQFGKGALMKLGASPQKVESGVIPSGSLQ